MNSLDFVAPGGTRTVAIGSHSLGGCGPGPPTAIVGTGSEYSCPTLCSQLIFRGVGKSLTNAVPPVWVAVAALLIWIVFALTLKLSISVPVFGRRSGEALQSGSPVGIQSGLRGSGV